MHKNFGRTVATIIGVIAAALVMFSIFSIFSAAEEATRSEFYEMEFCTDVYLKADGSLARKIVADAAKGENGMADAWIIDPCTKGGVMALSSFMDNPFRINLKNGRYPVSRSEVIVPEGTAKIGDTVTVYVFESPKDEEEYWQAVNSGANNRDKSKAQKVSFRVCGSYTGGYYVGTVNNTWGIRTSKEDYITIMDKEDLSDENLLVSVSLKKKRELERQAELLSETYGVPARAAEGALAMYNQDPSLKDDSTTFLAMQLLIAYFFMLAMIVIVRNAFNISVNERLRDYSLLRCIGITRKQIIRMVIWEALIVGAVGSILGIAAGYLFVRGSFYFFVTRKGMLAAAEEFRFIERLYPRAVILTVCAVFIITLYSTIASIEKLYKLNLAEGLSRKEEYTGGSAFLSEKKDTKKQMERHEDNRAKKQRKNRANKNIIGAIVTKLFGVEVGYAYRNSGRRKGKFAITVFTFIFCTFVIIVLCSVFKSIGFMGIAALESSESRTFSGAFIADTKGEADHVVSDLTKLEDVKGTMLIVEDLFITNERGVILYQGVEDAVYKKLKSYVGTYEEDSEADANVIEFVVGKAAFQDDFTVDLFPNTDPRKIHIAARLVDPKGIEYIAGIAGQDVMLYSDKLTVFVYRTSSGFRGFQGDANKSPESMEEKDGWTLRYFNQQLSVFVEAKDIMNHPQLDEYINRSSCYYISQDDELLEMGNMMVIIRWIVLSVLIISILLYFMNTLNIQKAMLMHRKSEFEILSILGMTRKQMYRSLDIEAFLGNALGLAIGILASIGGIAAAKYYVEKALDMKDLMPVMVDWGSVVLSIFLAFVTAFFSAILNRRTIITLLDN